MKEEALRWRPIGRICQDPLDIPPNHLPHVFTIKHLACDTVLVVEEGEEQVFGSKIGVSSISCNLRSSRQGAFDARRTFIAVLVARNSRPLQE